MNTETVQLNMTPQEADSVAYVLMSALRLVSMLDRERTDTHAAATTLFRILDYGINTDDHGIRIEVNANA